MGLARTVNVTCDKCGRGPEDAAYDRDLYGWVSIRVDHLATNSLGHNQICMIPELALCPTCWPKVLVQVNSLDYLSLCEEANPK